MHFQRLNTRLNSPVDAAAMAYATQRGRVQLTHRITATVNQSRHLNFPS